MIYVMKIGDVLVRLAVRANGRPGNLAQASHSAAVYTGAALLERGALVDRSRYDHLQCVELGDSTLLPRGARNRIVSERTETSRATETAKPSSPGRSQQKTERGSCLSYR